MAPAGLPIVGHRDLTAPMAWRAGQFISAQQFVRDVIGTAANLPGGRGIMNLCQDRYRFAVVFCACLIADRLCLLPQNQTERALQQIAEGHPGCIAIVEEPLAGCPVPMYRLADLERPADGFAEVPRIPADRVAALVFTSGSTGAPKANFKEWGRLVAGAHAERIALGLPVPFNVVGTVPSQHMYGFESVVLLPLLTGGAFHVSRPLFASDVKRALDEIPSPRALVTAPIHVRACTEDTVGLAPLEVIVSASAPLGRDMALRTEERFATRVMEIYGFTEAGMVASRRTTQTDVWRNMQDIELVPAGDAWAFTGGHVHGTKVATDLIVPENSGAFRLAGRPEDLVNVAGKRASLADLTHKLMEIPGVRDGVFHMPETSEHAVARLMAFVVAPDLSEAQLLEQLRHRIDAAFLPRPLVKLAGLPRNASGKLPLATLRALEAQARERPRQVGKTDDANHVPDVSAVARSQPQFCIAPEHPALAGHFPGNPIVPGVLLLSHVVDAFVAWHGPVRLCGAPQVKFLAPLLPQTPCSIDFDKLAADRVEFVCRTGAMTIARGVLAFEPLAGAVPRGRQ